MVLLAAYLLTGKELPKGISAEFFADDSKKAVENKENFEDKKEIVKEGFVTFDVIDPSKITPMTGLWIAVSIFVSIWSAFLAWCSAPADENIIGRIFWTIFAFIFGEFYIIYHFFLHEGHGKCPRSYTLGSYVATANALKKSESSSGYPIGPLYPTNPSRGGKKLRKGKGKSH